MSKYKGEEKEGVLKIKKSYEKISDENYELLKELELITIEEIISAIKKISKELEIETKFTYEKLKNKVDLK